MQLQREKTIGQSLGKIVTNFQDVSPAEVTPDVFNSQQWVETLCVEMLSSRNLYWEPESTAFTGNRLCGRTWSNTCLSSSFPEGMQVFSVNHRVCTDHLDSAPLRRVLVLHSGSGGKPPAVRVPRCQPEANIPSWLGCFNSFCVTVYRINTSLARVFLVGRFSFARFCLPTIS